MLIHLTHQHLFVCVLTYTICNIQTQIPYTQLSARRGEHNKKNPSLLLYIRHDQQQRICVCIYTYHILHFGYIRHAKRNFHPFFGIPFSPRCVLIRANANRIASHQLIRNTQLYMELLAKQAMIANWIYDLNIFFFYWVCFQFHYPQTLCDIFDRARYAICRLTYSHLQAQRKIYTPARNKKKKNIIKNRKTTWLAEHFINIMKIGAQLFSQTRNHRIIVGPGKIV